MKNKTSHIQRIILFYFLFLVLLFFVFLLKPRIIFADTPKANDIDDGINNWSQTSDLSPGYKNADFGTKLGYTFGSWSTHNPSIENSSSENPHGKPENTNFFYEYTLGNKPIKIQALYMHPLSNDPRTSLDYHIVTDPDLSSPILGNDKLFKKGTVTYTSKDINGNRIIKHMYIDNDKKIEVEQLLRPSENSALGITQELFVKNIGSKPYSYGVANGEDTDLNGNDQITVRALGDNRGLYIQSGNYKFNMNINVKDGPNRYLAFHYPKFQDGETWIPLSNTGENNTFKGTNFKNITGNEADNPTTGTALYGSSTGSIFNTKDSAYTLLWPWRDSLDPGETDHYSVGINMNQSPYSDPIMSKSYEDESSSDGKVHVGDRVKYTLDVQNEGYNAEWGIKRFEDTIPEGFNLNGNSIKIIGPDGKDISPEGISYNKNTRKLVVIGKDLNISDNQHVKVTFDGTIEYSSSDKIITNVGYVIGKDLKVSSGNVETLQSETSFHVEKVNYRLNLEKYVKNETKGDQDFKKRSIYSPGDTIKYKLDYKINSENQEKLKPFIKLTDKLSNKLDYVSNSAQSILKKADNTNESLSIEGDSPNSMLIKGSNNFDNGETVEITFLAKVKNDVTGLISNTATITSTPSGEDKPYVTESNEVDLAIPYKIELTKKVKNVTRGDTKFNDDSTYLIGDDVYYKVDLKLDSNNKGSLNSPLSFKDQLNKNLSFVPGSIKAQLLVSGKLPEDLNVSGNEGKDDFKISRNSKDKSNFDKNGIIEILYKTKVVGNVDGIITNQASISGVTDIKESIEGSSNLSNLVPAKNLQFTVPKKIDFGTHTAYSNGPFKNISTIGQAGTSEKTLVVNNVGLNHYDILVSFNNKIISKSGDYLEPDSYNSLIKIKQIGNDNYTIVNTSGTSLSNGKGFDYQGVKDFTKDIGPGKWELAPKSLNGKSGSYDGTLTWTLSDTI